MKKESEILEMIMNKNITAWQENLSASSINLIKSKLNEIPNAFYEPRIELEDERRISLIEFSFKTCHMSPERKNYLAEKYHINLTDLGALQNIVTNIKVTGEYGSIENIKKENKESKPYGFALADENKLDKAYPLWVAYLFADSIDPIQDVKAKLKEDGMEKKYDAEYIVGLIDHTNKLMADRPSTDKKDLYMHSISGILEEKDELTKVFELEERL